MDGGNEPRNSRRSWVRTGPKCSLNVLIKMAVFITMTGSLTSLAFLIMGLEKGLSEEKLMPYVVCFMISVTGLVIFGAWMRCSLNAILKLAVCLFLIGAFISLVFIFIGIVDGMPKENFLPIIICLVLNVICIVIFGLWNEYLTRIERARNYIERATQNRQRIGVSETPILEPAIRDILPGVQTTPVTVFHSEIEPLSAENLQQTIRRGPLLEPGPLIIPGCMVNPIWVSRNTNNDENEPQGASTEDTPRYFARQQTASQEQTPQRHQPTSQEPGPSSQLRRSRRSQERNQPVDGRGGSETSEAVDTPRRRLRSATNVEVSPQQIPRPPNRKQHRKSRRASKSPRSGR